MCNLLIMHTAVYNGQGQDSMSSYRAMFSRNFSAPTLSAPVTLEQETA